MNFRNNRSLTGKKQRFKAYFTFLYPCRFSKRKKRRNTIAVSNSLTNHLRLLPHSDQLSSKDKMFAKYKFMLNILSKIHVFFHRFAPSKQLLFFFFFTEGYYVLIFIYG